eukprot:gene6208-8239_t
MRSVNPIDPAMAIESNRDLSGATTSLTGNVLDRYHKTDRPLAREASSIILAMDETALRRINSKYQALQIEPLGQKTATNASKARMFLDNQESLEEAHKPVVAELQERPSERQPEPVPVAVEEDVEVTPP